ncbi:hypothetical protein CCR95_22690 [Thiocystis minor]|uniref:hypothetical protein n=1 Tax=Thiocystis minor TaxID=61597 RepID=UPI001911F31C|nr:hypothetical protein [Thiocystis minor]MBK5966804.1 hypothetical protein [Thiocystis minor]
MNIFISHLKELLNKTTNDMNAFERFFDVIDIKIELDHFEWFDEIGDCIDQLEDLAEITDEYFSNNDYDSEEYKTPVEIIEECIDDMTNAIFESDNTLEVLEPLKIEIEILEGGDDADELSISIGILTGIVSDLESQKESIFSNCNQILELLTNLDLSSFEKHP